MIIKPPPQAPPFFTEAKAIDEQLRRIKAALPEGDEFQGLSGDDNEDDEDDDDDDEGDESREWLAYGTKERAAGRVWNGPPPGHRLAHEPEPILVTGEPVPNKMATFDIEPYFPGISSALAKMNSEYQRQFEWVDGQHFPRQVRSITDVHRKYSARCTDKRRA